MTRLALKAEHSERRWTPVRPSTRKGSGRWPEADSRREAELQVQESRARESAAVVQRVREIERLLAAPNRPEQIHASQLELTRMVLDGHPAMAGLSCCFKP